MNDNTPKDLVELVKGLLELVKDCRARISALEDENICIAKVCVNQQEEIMAINKRISNLIILVQ